ncbi:hypothetical protein [Halorubrum sp. Atlit-26R]|uniref:hypothetical protein n=1 Tax=Halorubrum sp. Atlit-26R TaxID=2282128 RepID=UPI000EF17DC2|nr:hypothetical protein [Halorubrum sp. Atlit-26R]RLM76545.1 hypothetical protein DVK07_02275 [Halorubrum sp. Atlit-26R]
MTGTDGGPADGDALAADDAAFRRYLLAKRTVDDRALDRRLVGILRERLADRAAARDGPLRVLEVGAGVGTMVARLIDWEVLPPGETRYVAVDRDPDALAGLGPFLREWAAERDAPTSVDDGGSGDYALVVETDERVVAVEPVAADAPAYAAAHAGESDALIGMALLDVLGLDRLDPLLDALAPGGTYYFPITFDGGTRFRPAHPDDRAIETLYHRHMDEKPGGNSRAGGAALVRLREADGSTLLGAAGSDWIARPADGEAGYPGDEAFFLRHILDTVEAAVGEVIAGGDETASVSAADLDAWLEIRRQQVDDGELVYLTHQLDLIGRVEGDA